MEEKSIASTEPQSREDSTKEGVDLLTEKSEEVYQIAYDAFKKWQTLHSSNALTTESVLLDYFKKLSSQYKSSTLWTTYSMLKRTLNSHEGINIKTFSKLRYLLREKAQGYETKKASTFTPDNIKTFLNKAPDDQYLPTKVALIFGVIGACQSVEMYEMKMSAIQDHRTAISVTIPKSKHKPARQFTVTGHFYTICKNYLCGRTAENSTYVFYHYKCSQITRQKMGMNCFIKMARDIAIFLKLTEPESYTGHSFRRSSATILIDASGDITSLHANSDCKFIDTITEDYVDEPVMRNEESSIKVPPPLISDDSIPSEDLKKGMTNMTMIINGHEYNIDSIENIIFNQCTVTINNYFTQL